MYLFHSFWLHFAELCDDAHTDALVKGAAAEQPLLVGRPVEAGDRLGGEVACGQQLHTACNTQLVPFMVLVASAAVQQHACKCLIVAHYIRRCKRTKELILPVPSHGGHKAELQGASCEQCTRC